jgi:hypothetical protein
MKKILCILALFCGYAQAQTSIVLNPGPGTDYMATSCGGQSVNAVAVDIGVDGNPVTIVTVTTRCGLSGRVAKSRTYLTCAYASYTPDGLTRFPPQLIFSGSSLSGTPMVACPVGADASAVYDWTDASGNVVDARTLSTAVVSGKTRAVLTLP